MKTTISLLFGIGLLATGVYFGLNVVLTPTNSAVQQAVTAVWSVAAITALGFSGLLLANAK